MERALTELREALTDAPLGILFSGPPGIGKTLALRLLVERLTPGLPAVYLPYPSLPASAIAAWALEELQHAAGSNPLAALLALARERRGLALLIDDAQSLPRETAEELLQTTHHSDGTLRLVLAIPRDEVESCLERWGHLEQVTLNEAMSPAETAEYVNAYLEKAHISSEVSAAFDEERLATLQLSSKGIPNRVNAEASLTLRSVLGRIEASAKAEARAELERAVGRLALAHSDWARGIAVDTDFERATGRLVLSHAERLGNPNAAVSLDTLGSGSEAPPTGASEVKSALASANAETSGKRSEATSLRVAIGSLAFLFALAAGIGLIKVRERPHDSMLAAPASTSRLSDLPAWAPGAMADPELQEAFALAPGSHPRSE